MALWVCLDCTAGYAVDAPRCPNCGSTEWAEQGTEEAEAAMAKITRQGGPSVEPAELDQTDQTAEQQHATPLLGATEGDTTEPVDGDEYDPGDYTVAEVNAYLDQCQADNNPTEFKRVGHAERVGKARAGILNRFDG